MEIESEAKTAISKISSKYNFTWVIPHFEQLIERTPIKQFTFGKLETGLNVEALKDIYLKADMWDMKEFNDLFLKTESLKYVHENWQDIKPSQNMKDFLFEAEVDWVEELMFARFFGFGKK
ncbi:7489_t:CDS:2 [Entrophospora sp. SA101]|nr:7489_t:CDS:2 [Entrophospora sp. SA101]